MTKDLRHIGARGSEMTNHIRHIGTGGSQR